MIVETCRPPGGKLSPIRGATAASTPQSRQPARRKSTLFWNESASGWISIFIWLAKLIMCLILIWMLSVGRKWCDFKYAKDCGADRVKES
jgi:hypothetical protein